MKSEQELIECAADTDCPIEDLAFVQSFAARLHKEGLEQAIHQAIMHLMDEWHEAGVYTGQSGWGYWSDADWTEAKRIHPCSKEKVSQAWTIYAEMEKELVTKKLSEIEKLQ